MATVAEIQAEIDREEAAAAKRATPRGTARQRTVAEIQAEIDAEEKAAAQAAARAASKTTPPTQGAPPAPRGGSVQAPLTPIAVQSPVAAQSVGTAVQRTTERQSGTYATPMDVESVRAKDDVRQAVLRDPEGRSVPLARKPPEQEYERDRQDPPVSDTLTALGRALRPQTTPIYESDPETGEQRETGQYATESLFWTALRDLGSLPMTVVSPLAKALTYEVDAQGEPLDPTELAAKVDTLRRAHPDAYKAMNAALTIATGPAGWLAAAAELPTGVNAIGRAVPEGSTTGAIEAIRTGRSVGDEMRATRALEPTDARQAIEAGEDVDVDGWDYRLLGLAGDVMLPAGPPGLKTALRTGQELNAARVAGDAVAAKRAITSLGESRGSAALAAAQRAARAEAVATIERARSAEDVAGEPIDTLVRKMDERVTASAKTIRRTDEARSKLDAADPANAVDLANLKTQRLGAALAVARGMGAGPLADAYRLRLAEGRSAAEAGGKSLADALEAAHPMAMEQALVDIALDSKLLAGATRSPLRAGTETLVRTGAETVSTATDARRVPGKLTGLDDRTLQLTAAEVLKSRPVKGGRVFDLASDTGVRTAAQQAQVDALLAIKGKAALKAANGQTLTLAEFRELSEAVRDATKAAAPGAIRAPKAAVAAQGGRIPMVGPLLRRAKAWLSPEKVPSTGSQLTLVKVAQREVAAVPMKYARMLQDAVKASPKATPTEVVEKLAADAGVSWDDVLRVISPDLLETTRLRIGAVMDSGKSGRVTVDLLEGADGLLRWPGVASKRTAENQQGLPVIMAATMRAMQVEVQRRALDALERTQTGWLGSFEDTSRAKLLDDVGPQVLTAIRRAEDEMLLAMSGGGVPGVFNRLDTIRQDLVKAVLPPPRPVTAVGNNQAQLSRSELRGLMYHAEQVVSSYFDRLLQAAATTGSLTEVPEPAVMSRLAEALRTGKTPFGDEVRRGIEALSEAQTSRAAHEALRSLDPLSKKEIGEALAWVWSSALRIARAGIMPGFVRPNLKYHGVNFITAPSIIATTLGSSAAGEAVLSLARRLVGRSGYMLTTPTRTWTPEEITEALETTGVLKSQEAFEFGSNELVDMMRTLGLDSRGNKLGKARALLGQIDPERGTTAWSRLAEYSDQLWRRAVFEAALSTGKSVEQAADDARAALLDYSSLGKADDIIKKLTIAWTFTSRMLGAVIDSLARRPNDIRRMALVSRELQRNINEDIEQSYPWVYDTDIYRPALYRDVGDPDAPGDDVQIQGPTIPPLQSLAMLFSLAHPSEIEEQIPFAVGLRYMWEFANAADAGERGPLLPAGQTAWLEALSWKHPEKAEALARFWGLSFEEGDPEEGDRWRSPKTTLVPGAKKGPNGEPPARQKVPGRFRVNNSRAYIGTMAALYMAGVQRDLNEASALSFPSSDNPGRYEALRLRDDYSAMKNAARAAEQAGAAFGLLVPMPPPGEMRTADMLKHIEWKAGKQGR